MKEILKRALNVCLVMFMLIVVTSILSAFLPDETEKLLVEFSWISKLVNMVLYIAFTYYVWIVSAVRLEPLVPHTCQICVFLDCRPCRA